MSADGADGVVRAGAKVLVKMPSNNCKIVSIRSPDQTVLLGKFGAFNAASLIGCPFGASYEILHDRNLLRLDSSKSEIDIRIDPDDDLDNNNSTLIDRAESQKLSRDEIEKLKQEALKGDLDSKVLIKTLVENSDSFEGKTSFAKQKYVRRKERKFSKRFQALEPNTRNLCEYYFNSKPQKTKGLRIDTLSQILCNLNTMATSKILVADSVGGLLVGAILERMIDNSQEDFGGRVFAMLDGDTPNFDIVREMNFPEGVVEKKLEVLPWSRLEPGPNEDDPIPEPPNPEDETAMHRHNRKIAAIAKTKAARKNLELASFDGLAVACQFDSLEVLNKLTPFLGYSRPIVVYSQYKESLIPAYLMMRASPDYVNAQLTETMTREYQVPVSGLGTHPFMMTSGTGGFLLTATRVYAGDCAVASATHAMKRRQRAEAGAGAEDGDETAGAGAGPKDRKSKLTNHTEGPKKQRKI